MSFGGRLHGEFQPGLKFSCDYMANFSPGAMFKIGREKIAGKRFTFTTQTEIGHVIGPLGTVIRSCKGQRFISIVFMGEEWEIQTGRL